MFRPSRLGLSLLLLYCAAIPLEARADTLSIGSSPAGASVEIDGVVVGVTPCVLKYPGGYFHKTKSVFGQKLEHTMTLRISKEGFAAKEIQLTEGPFDWVNLAGHDRGRYYLLKTNKIAVVLDVASAPAPRRVKDDIPDAGKVEYRVETPGASSISTDLPNGGFVEIISNPPGAAIYVDGQFAGQTPSRIHMESATHHLEVKSAGHETWQRDLLVNSESQVSLHADLIESKSAGGSPDK